MSRQIWIITVAILFLGFSLYSQSYRPVISIYPIPNNLSKPSKIQKKPWTDDGSESANADKSQDVTSDAEYLLMQDELSNCLLENPMSKLPCYNRFRRKLQRKLLLKIQDSLDQGWNNVTAYQDNWGPMDLLRPTHECDWNSFTRIGGVVGNADGGKWICNLPDNCILYSVGSRGDFSFEEAVRKFSNKCEIHTFDCTIPKDTKPPEGVQFHPWCMGQDEKKDGKIFKTLETIMKDLNHNHVTHLKLDCEGCEWLTLKNLNEPLPQTLWFELHAWEGHMELAFGKGLSWTEAMVKLGLILDDYGYAIVVNEHNPGCAACGEFMLQLEGES